MIISSLLPRSDNMEKVKLFNECLTKMTRKIRSGKFMANNNITDRMLKDRKHLDLKGFRILLANIRFTVFGKLPKTFAASRFNDKSIPRGGNSSYNNRRNMSLLNNQRYS